MRNYARDAVFYSLDIETVPTQNPDIIEQIRAELEPPKSLKKAESIEAWWKEQSEEVLEQKLQKTSVDTLLAETVAIAFKIGNLGTCSTYRRIDKAGSEAEMLDRFYSKLQADIKELGLESRPMIPVGHNLTFDLDILKNRSFVHQIEPPDHMPMNEPAWSNKLLCTQFAMAGRNGFVSQDMVAKILGIPGKGDMTGADVWGAVKEGRYDDIRRYCASDVERQALIADKITFGRYSACLAPTARVRPGNAVSTSPR